MIMIDPNGVDAYNNKGLALANLGKRRCKSLTQIRIGSNILGYTESGIWELCRISAGFSLENCCIEKSEKPY